MDTHIKIGVVIATKGRSSCAAPVIASLAQQTLKPEITVFSVTAPTDLPPDMEILCQNAGITIISLIGPIGSTRQRNTGIEKIHALVDAIVFIDDDFLMASDWLENCAQLFALHDSIVGMSGTLIKDGAVAGSLTWHEASQLIESARATAPPPPTLQNITHTYGCNMAFRCSAINDLRFDERLVLYGWLEDNDFSRRVARKGQLVRSNLLIGVHLGIGSGRVSGRRLGYSQIVNPIYLFRKGVMPFKIAIKTMLWPLLANIVKSARPEPTIDRRGRLLGNIMGLCEIATFHCRPEKAIKM